MNIQDFDKYDASRQLEKWSQVKASLSIEEKENMVEDAINKDIWGYFDLLSEILSRYIRFKIPEPSF